MEVTVCLTSCGRPDLLEVTLDSFFKWNTYPVKEFLIYEDSGTSLIRTYKREGHYCVGLHHCFKGVTLIDSKERKGQIIALDTLYSRVTTPYIFHLEDDWKFLKSGFIEKSMAILEKHPDILQVRLCELEPYSQHPVDYSRGFGVLKSEPNLWSATNFNPSLKRKSDYNKIGSFGQHTTFNFYKPWKSEGDISRLYHKLGYKAAILNENYIQHIGVDRHVTA